MNPVLDLRRRQVGLLLPMRQTIMKRELTTLLAIAALFVGLGLANAADKASDENVKPYPLETCVVSGEKLGEMGDPYVLTYKGQEIKLCCKDCAKDFDKTPEKYLAKLKKAEKEAEKAGKKAEKKADAHAEHSKH